MGVALSILAILVLLIIWLRIDFVNGMKKQKSEAHKREQVTRYGTVSMQTTGDDFYKAMFQDIEQATDHVHILFYIVSDDNISSKLVHLIQEKAKQGVTVRLLVDRMGSRMKKKTIQQLKDAGVLFAYSHPIKWPYLFFTFNRRNHRKITIIDGKIGFVGGYNVGDEYLGRDPKYGPWRDYHLRLVGDGVQDLQEQFLEDWKVATKESLNKERYYPTLVKGTIPLRILPTDGVYLEEAFIDFVKQAKTTIRIGTPYFIPGKALEKELIAASKRGVDVKLLVPKQGDHPLVKEASFPYFKELLKAGVDVYQYYRGFYHAKVVIIDNQLCDIGTANFDKRSFHINHEINCIIYDREFIQTVINEIEHDMSVSERLTLNAVKNRTFFQKGKDRVAQLVSGLL
ncbi:cardiolipin synthase [Bacillus alkalicellulosilyticus]|uniref:cardiolipin synthase n=1 Tax=Alkalihalobacterium alkalicellulosilyticum TaxID=1912214 RepID=UPI000995E762|nr:cardiolipin synthase [Bacillus alkalicellulosilyticus]